MKQRKNFTLLLALVLLMLAPLAGAEGVAANGQDAQQNERRVFFSEEEANLDPDAPKLEVYTCDVLGSDSHLIVLGDESILVDASTVTQADHVLAMLEKAGVTRLTYAFNTHPHDDHAGGFPAVFEKIPTDELLVTWQMDAMDKDGTIHRQLLKSAAEHGVPVRVLQPEEILQFGDAEVKIVYEPKASSINGQSAMMQLTYHNTHMLFGADVTGHSLSVRIEKYPFRAEIVKYPHHGINKLPGVFWDTVQPEFAVIAHGTVNTLAAQKDLDKRGIRYAFATHGVIRMISDGERWLVEQLSDAVQSN